MTNYKFNLQKDREDKRDYYHIPRLSLVELPKSVDLRAGMPQVEDQGELGSCTAQAGSGAIHHINLKYKKPVLKASRLFMYYEARVLLGTINEDSGATIADLFKVMNKVGYPDEKLWPYAISKFKKKPLLKAYTNAKLNKITKYERVLPIVSQFKQVLADNRTIVVGMNVYNSMMSDIIAKTGNIMMPNSSDELLGGHAVLVMGYDDSNKTFLVRNSWGVNWGINGYFRLPYEYLKNEVNDCWTVESV